MSRRRIAAIALTGALVAGGTGVAIAAAGKDNGKQAEQAVLDDAAKRLDVTPEKLRDALGAAQDAQIDEAVKADKLTQKQADAIKAARKASGHVLGPLGRPGLHHKHFGPGGRGMRGGPLDDIAKALGTTPAKLFESLRAGKSIADVAKANGKSVADVRAAAKAAVRTRLDKAVKDGDLTRKQADAILERITEHVTEFGPRKAMRLRRHHFRGGEPPAGAPRPGSFMPGGPDEVQVAPPGDVIF
jgi:uncharacterized protein (DUF433 family)